VIIVVNGSDPSVLNVARSHPIGATVIPLMENIGFGLACNIGAKEAHGKFLVFLNDDTVVRPDWLANLVRAADKPNVGAVGSLLLKDDETILEAGARMLSTRDVHFHGLDMPIADARQSVPELLSPRQVEYVSGAALLVNAELFAKLGGFDPRFAPAYYEDVDLQFRLRAAGYEIWIEPSARVFHLTNASTGDMNGFRNFALENSRVYFTDRWGQYIGEDRYNRALPLDDILIVPPSEIVVDGLATASSEPQLVAREAMRIQVRYSKWLEESLDAEINLVADLRAQLEQSRIDLDNAEAAKIAAVDHLKNRIGDMWNHAERLQERITELEAEVAFKDQNLDYYGHSLSWRITAPLRAIRKH